MAQYQKLIFFHFFLICNLAVCLILFYNENDLYVLVCTHLISFHNYFFIENAQYKY